MKFGLGVYYQQRIQIQENSRFYVINKITNINKLSQKKNWNFGDKNKNIWVQEYQNVIWYK